MPYSSFKYCFGGCLGIIFGDFETQLPQSVGVGSVLRAGQKHAQLRQIVRSRRRRASRRKQIVRWQLGCMESRVVRSQSAESRGVLRQRSISNGWLCFRAMANPASEQRHTMISNATDRLCYKAIGSSDREKQMYSTSTRLERRNCCQKMGIQAPLFNI